MYQIVPSVKLPSRKATSEWRPCVRSWPSITLDRSCTPSRLNNGGSDVKVPSARRPHPGRLRLRQSDQERNVLPDLHRPILVPLGKAEEPGELGGIAEETLVVAVHDDDGGVQQPILSQAIHELAERAVEVVNGVKVVAEQGALKRPQGQPLLRGRQAVGMVIGRRQKERHERDGLGAKPRHGLREELAVGQPQSHVLDEAVRLLEEGALETQAGCMNAMFQNPPGAAHADSVA
jgi:hypothetical protein